MAGAEVCTSEQRVSIQTSAAQDTTGAGGRKHMRSSGPVTTCCSINPAWLTSKIHFSWSCALAPVPVQDFQEVQVLTEPLNPQNSVEPSD